MGRHSGHLRRRLDASRTTRKTLHDLEPLSPRASSVLYAVVSEFIATGEPVGSRTLAKKYGFDLSPATIRNELKDLEDEGYLEQPHTSAGRVPTERAYRLFIDALMRVREIPAEDAERIRELFRAARPGRDLLRETGKLLSDLSGVPAILLRDRSEQRTVQKLRFILTRPGEMLGVIVLSDGTVENRFISLESTPDSTQLERLHNLLDEVVSGRTLRDVREHLGRMARKERDELVALQRLGESLVGAAVQGVDRSKDIVIEGRSSLLSGPGAVDAGRVRDLMMALDDRERLVLLLDRALDSSHVQVFLGQETERLVGHPVSLVAAPFRPHSAGPGGAVGVIGPPRMDYPFLVPLVGATANAMARALSSQNETSGSEGDSRPGPEGPTDMPGEGIHDDSDAPDS